MKITIDHTDFNAADYAIRAKSRDEAGYKMYLVDPGIMYSTMIAYATSVLAADEIGFLPRDQRGYVATLRELGDLQAADCHIDEVGSEPQRLTREAILETLRLWFTRMLQAELGPGIGIKITADDPYVLAYWRLAAK